MSTKTHIPETEADLSPVWSLPYLHFFQSDALANILFQEPRKQVFQRIADKIATGNRILVTRSLSGDDIEKLKLCLSNERTTAVDKTI